MENMEKMENNEKKEKKAKKTKKAKSGGKGKKILKYVLIGFAALLVIGLFSGGDTEEEGPKDRGELGPYGVAILDYTLAKDFDGKDAIIISYEFTNNSEEEASFDIALIDKAFQDGVSLETAIVYKDDTSFDLIDDNVLTSIKPGKSITIKRSYVLNDTTTPVVAEVEKTFGDDQKIEKTFNIA